MFGLGDKRKIFNPISIALGEVTMLMMESDLHRRYFIYHLTNRIVPALKFQQYKIYYKNKRPIAFICWSNLSEEVEKKYMQGDYDLKFDEWNSGNRIWFNEFIASHNDANEIAMDIATNIFPNKKWKSIKRDKDGNKIKICKWQGIEFYKKRSNQEPDDLVF